MAAEDESQSKISVNNVVDWNVHNEVQLLLALMGHKPVGKTISSMIFVMPLSIPVFAFCQNI